MADSSSRQKHLTLKEKIEIIKEAKKNIKLGVRDLCQHFNCGKTQIAMILNRKRSYWLCMKVMLLRNLVK